MFRPYQTEDLPKVLTFVGECLRDSDFCNWHPGDIVHWMSNQHLGKELEKRFWIYEENEVLALAHLSSEQKEFALIVKPQAREALELSLLQECLANIQQQMLTEKPERQTLSISVAVSDKKRIVNLNKLGFQEDSVHGPVGKLLLSGIFSETKLPEGFYIRNVAGEHEASLVIEVHNASFDSAWMSDEYLQVMRTPGFDAQRELVVVAPDGRFVAFLVYWLDPITKTGLFEPVGCHQDFRRKGLTKALMVEGLRHMAEAGMETVLVGYDADNESAHKLYASVGFIVHCDYVMYSKNNLAK